MLFWLLVGGLAAPAVLLTLNRLVDLQAGPAVRVLSFTPLATPCYLAAGLLVGGVLVAKRGPRRVLAPTLALLLVGLGLHAWWLAPAFIGDHATPRDGARPVVVLNANVYEGSADPQALVGVLRDDRVDVAVLEEITFGLLEDLEAAGIDDVLPYRLGEPNGAVDGTMVFSRTPMGDSNRLDTRFQSWVVDIGDPDGGDESLILVAAHPQAPVLPADVGPWRAEHELLLKASVAVNADLVLGDLNASADHAEFRAWLEGGWRDSLERVNAGWSPTWPSNGITPVPGLRLPPLFQLDHILVGPRLAVTASRTIEIAGTDHRAVIATVARTAE